MGLQIDLKQIPKDRRNKSSNMHDISARQYDTDFYYQLHKIAISKIIKRGLLEREIEKRRRTYFLPRDNSSLIKIVDARHGNLAHVITYTYDQL